MTSENVIRAVIFDIGGVVIGSPVVGVTKFEKLHHLPPHYLNALITAHGENGSFQRLERGELSMEEFLNQFTKEMSQVKLGNRAYEKYCQRFGQPCPPLPKSLNIDGREMWSTMMAESTRADPIMVEAIRRLRNDGRYKVVALTNNWVTNSSSGPDASYLITLFDAYFESSVVGLRKPDPAFFLYALDKLGIQRDQAGSVIFLDDIGHNLKSAKNLGFRTIRVLPSKSIEAVRELGQMVEMELIKAETSTLSARL